MTTVSPMKKSGLKYFPRDPAAEPTLRVGHLLHEMCGASSTFIYRLVTNPAVINSVFCHHRTHQDLYPHAQVSMTRGSQNVKRISRKIVGPRLANRISKHVEKLEWRRFLRRFQPHVLHCQHGYHAVRYYPLLKSTNLPFVVTFHGSDINGATFNKEYLRNLKVIFDKAESCLFVSKALQKRAIELGASPTKSRIVYLGVDEPDFTPTNSQRTTDCQFAVVASFVPCKGHDTILQAFQNALQTLPGAKLHLFGQGPLQDRIQWLIKSLQLEDNVRVHGEIQNSDVLRFLAENIDVVVQPSQRDDAGCEEGLPTSLCEAATLSIPCIGTNCGGTSELLLDDETGLLISQRHVAGLEHAIIRLAHDPALRFRLGRSLNSHYKEMIRSGHGLDGVTEVYHSVCATSSRRLNANLQEERQS